MQRGGDGKNLSKGIFSKLAGSLLSADIGGRLFKGRADDDAPFPYAVYMIVSDAPDDVFGKKGESVLIQFSLFSAQEGSTEIEDMYTHLKALYDDCAMNITAGVLLWFKRENAALGVEDYTTTAGLQKVWAYHVDYLVTVQAT